MATNKTSERVNDDARREAERASSDLVEVVKRNGDFRKNYGPLLGALLFWLSIKAACPGPLRWGGWFVGGAFLLQTYGWLFRF
jgi:hypothetical protein